MRSCSIVKLFLLYIGPFIVIILGVGRDKRTTRGMNGARNVRKVLVKTKNS